MQVVYRFKTGVLLESFGGDIRTSMERAYLLGIEGIQMYAAGNEFSPETITRSKIIELRNIADAYGLVITALCGDLGCGFGNKDMNPSLIERSMRILELARELGTNIVTAHIGVIPANPEHERYKIMLDACAGLSDCAHKADAYYAIETGPEKADVLFGFLENLDCRSIAVNLDPANLVMVTGDDPVHAVYTLNRYIVHTHAKDGIRLRDSDPEVVYGVRKIDDVIREGKDFMEVALGEGSVPWERYLKALDDIGYHGFLTIERETGENPGEDIEKAVKFLNGFKL